MTKYKIEISVIDEILLERVAGIYMIQFSNGRFYIGCSSDLKNRIMQHIRAIKSDFEAKRETCKALSLMKGFKGHVSFYLIELIDITGESRWGTPKKLLNKEAFHIMNHKQDKQCLNWDRKAYKRAISVRGVL